MDPFAAGYVKRVTREHCRDKRRLSSLRLRVPRISTEFFYRFLLFQLTSLEKYQTSIDNFVKYRLLNREPRIERRRFFSEACSFSTTCSCSCSRSCRLGASIGFDERESRFQRPPQPTQLLSLVLFLSFLFSSIPVLFSQLFFTVAYYGYIFFFSLFFPPEDSKPAASSTFIQAPFLPLRALDSRGRSFCSP